MTDSERNGASTTERVADILLAFAEGERLGVSELARRVSLSKAVVHRILQTLVHRSLLRYNGGTRDYSLGVAAIGLSRASTRQNELHAAAAPVIARLSSATGETTILSQRQGYRRFYIDQVESAQPIRITIAVGGSYPITVGASGLAMLAFLPDADLDAALSLPLERFTERTTVEVDALRERLVQIREQGWARTAGERVAEATSIAAPVLDEDGSPIGSLSAAYLTSRFSEEAANDLARLVKDAGADATTRYRQLRAI
ncbi:IclR family transcriptional regulator [Rathayibacter sp. PhB179]|nr:IclR family transcriptional regulator [Rathayibacter sp. PhB192]TCM25268.1 IclR family transcriptional regulator [Rathayibacter sp. PhB179]